VSSKRRERNVDRRKKKKITNDDVQFSKNQIHFIFLRIPIFRINRIDKDHDLSIYYFGIKRSLEQNV